MIDNGHHRKGLFVTFEGLDGSGKTTQAALLAQRLRAHGWDVAETAEPGGTRLGAALRTLLLEAGGAPVSPTAEMLLFFAARAQNADEIIVPALQAGKVVVCDRFTDSSLAYQGAGRELGESVVLELDRIACRGLLPDLTILLDIEPEEGLRRVRGGPVPDRMHGESAGFLRRVREAYLRLAEREPRRFRVIAAAGAIPEVAARVWEAAAAELAARFGRV